MEGCHSVHEASVCQLLAGFYSVCGRIFHSVLGMFSNDGVLHQGHRSVEVPAGIQVLEPGPGGKKLFQ